MQCRNDGFMLKLPQSCLRVSISKGKTEISSELKPLTYLDSVCLFHRLQQSTELIAAMHTGCETEPHALKR